MDLDRVYRDPPKTLHIRFALEDDVLGGKPTRNFADKIYRDRFVGLQITA